MQTKKRVTSLIRSGTRLIILTAIFMTAIVINFAPAAAQGSLDFNSYTLSSYGGTQDAACGSGAVIENGGLDLHLTGNCWKQIDYAYTVTANTIMEFDFQSSVETEIHGIGFDVDQTINNPINIFQLSGTQIYGIQDFDTYVTGSGLVHYTIPVGSYYTGSFTAMTFTNDNDAGPIGDSIFSNIQVYEGTPPPTPMLTVNGSSYAVESYGGASQDIASTTTILDGGLTLSIVGNGWKKVSIPYTIQSNTYLEFDFSSSAEGEIHGIGFDTDDVIDSTRTFQLYGTQVWGITDFLNYATVAPAVQHYVIPVGSYYTGSFTALTFTNDHDVASPTGESVFSNIVIYNLLATPTITFDPAPTPQHPGGDFTVNATTDSDGALTYSYVSGPCTLVDANAGTFTPTGVGDCTVQADTPETAYFLAGSVQQVVTISPLDLYAVSGSTTLPDAVSVPVWGYNSSNTAVTQPGGPTIIVNEGDTVTIVLHNELSVDTALLFQGQDMIPDTTGVISGTTKLYTFTASRPGTYLYGAGLLAGAQYQSAMGLYGALIVRPTTAGQAYNDATTAYDDEAVLVLSEIDSALNSSATPETFDMRNYKPRYFLINGVAYPDTAEIPTAAGNRVLLRYLNAGSQFHSMALLGTHQTVIANDGSPLTYSHRMVAETFGPGQTIDTLVIIPAAAVDGSQFAIYDGSFLLHNSNAAGFGGMMTFLTVSGTPPTGDTTGPVASNVAYAAGSLTATIDDTATGGSTIAAAEYFMDTIGAPGTGTAMSGAFGSSTVAVSAAVSVPPGAHTLYVRGMDSSNNWGVFSSVLVNGGDASGPATTSLTVTPNPSNGSVDVALSATGNDSASGGSNIMAAEYFIDATGADGSALNMTVNVAAPVASLDGTISAATVAGLTEGTHTVYIHSQDAAGNWGAFATIDMVVDITGPATSNVLVSPNPSNGQVGINVTTPAVRMTATFTDSAANISAAEGFIDTVGANGTGFIFIASDSLYDSLSETGYSDIPLTTILQLADGDHTLYVHSRDAAGNWGSTSSVILVVDKTAPSVSAVSAAPNPTGGATIVTLGASATDTANAITAAEWFTGADPGIGNGTAMTVSGTGPWSLSATIDVSTWVNGSYTLNVRAQDAAGNWSTVGSTPLVVDAPPPPFPGLYFSTRGNTALPTVGGTADNADIYNWDGVTFSRTIDASGAGSLGLPGGANVDGFDWIDATHFYMSFSSSLTNVPGLGNVEDEDVVYYNNGVWSVYFDGTAQGLTNNRQDLNAINIVGGILYFSTVGNVNPTGVTGTADNADIYSWDGVSFARVWDATANGLPGDANIDGLVFVDATHFYLSFSSTATTMPVLGAVADVDVVYNNAGTWSVFFDGMANGLTAGSGQDIDAFDIP